MTGRRFGRAGASRASDRQSGGEVELTRPAHLSEEDARLWEIMRQRLQPLRNPKRRVTGHEPEPAPAHSVEAAPSPAPSRRPKPLLASAPANPARPAVFAPAIAPKYTLPKPAPVPAPIEKRKTRKLASGQRAIDAVLDLHGMRQSEAHAALRHFLGTAHARGHKFVKVITGKGARLDDDAARLVPFLSAWTSGGGERGVLKRLVPQWLQEDDLRRIVVGFSSAGRPHGGDGALYVELRRKSRG